MTGLADDAIFGSDLWATALERYASVTNLTVRLFGADGRSVFGPIHRTPLFGLFEESGYDPGIFTECAQRCMAQSVQERPAVLVSQFHGLAVVGTSLALDGSVVGAAVAGYAFADFSQVSEVQRLAQQSGIVFDRLWDVARRQSPVSRRRLIVQSELLQVLGDALLREHYRLRQYEQAAAIVDSSDDAIISEDLDGLTTSWNPGAERLFGYTAREAVGQPVTRLIHPDGPDSEQSTLELIRRGEKIDHFETVRRRKDGSVIEISLTASPIKDGNGGIIGASEIARDISERRRHEEHRELLMGELNHRVKNTLATVQALATQTLRHATDVTEARNRFQARLVALAKAHDLLTQEHWEGAGLTTVIAHSLAVYSTNIRESRFQVAGPAIRVRANAVLTLLMALHELATNALKYGALSNETGSVTITWQLLPDDPPRFQLRWAESGGPPVKPPQRRGFGSRLIEGSLAHELAGEARLTFARDGLVCIMEAPLDEVAGAALTERVS